MCLLGACKSNIMVRVGYLEEALKFITIIPINPELGICMCLLGSCKSNVVVHEGYLKEALNFIAKIYP